MDPPPPMFLVTSCNSVKMYVIIFFIYDGGGFTNPLFLKPPDFNSSEHRHANSYCQKVLPTTLTLHLLYTFKRVFEAALPTPVIVP